MRCGLSQVAKKRMALARTLGLTEIESRCSRCEPLRDGLRENTPEQTAILAPNKTRSMLAEQSSVREHLHPQLFAEVGAAHRLCAGNCTKRSCHHLGPSIAPADGGPIKFRRWWTPCSARSKVQNGIIDDLSCGRRPHPFRELAWSLCRLAFGSQRSLARRNL
jgi:hypothetical protein